MWTTVWKYCSFDSTKWKLHFALFFTPWNISMPYGGFKSITTQCFASGLQITYMFMVLSFRERERERAHISQYPVKKRLFCWNKVKPFTGTFTGKYLHQLYCRLVWGTRCGQSGPLVWFRSNLLRCLEICSMLSWVCLEKRVCGMSYIYISEQKVIMMSKMAQIVSLYLKAFHDGIHYGI